MNQEEILGIIKHRLARLANEEPENVSAAFKIDQLIKDGKLTAAQIHHVRFRGSGINQFMKYVRLLVALGIDIKQIQDEVAKQDKINW